MLLCYHGTDAFRLNEAIANLVASTRAREGASLAVEAIDCSAENAHEAIERHLKYPSFFGDRKLILATDAAGPVMADILDRFSPRTMDDIVLVAIQNTSVKGFDKKILSLLVRASDTTTELSPLTGKALEMWISEYCSQRQGSITPAASRMLQQRTEQDAGRISLELEKLCAYAQGTVIDETMVRLLTPARTERDEWELSNAIASYDKRSIVSALWRKLNEGTPEQMLVGSLAAGLRNLIMTNDLVNRHQPSAAIAKLTGLHPFVISKTMRGATIANTERLIRAYCTLATLDRASKEGTAHTVDGLFSCVLSL